MRQRMRPGKNCWRDIGELQQPKFSLYNCGNLVSNIQNNDDNNSFIPQLIVADVIASDQVTIYNI